MPDVKVHGLQAVLRELRKVPNDVRGKKLDAANRAGTKPVVSAAKRLVPRDTGALGESIRAVKDRQESSSERSHHNISYGAELFYGRFVELGTSQMRARSFLLKALLENQQSATNAIAKVLKRNLKLR